MAVITNNKANPLVGGRRVVGTRHNDAPEHLLDHAPTSARLVRVGPYVEGRRPARLAAAPRRAGVAGCAPRRRAGSLGWLAAMGAMAFLVVLAFAWAGGGSSAAPVPSTTTVVRIQPGQSLWDVARQYAPDSRADQVVAQIEQLNSLADDAVYPGELVRVPSSLRG